MDILMPQLGETVAEGTITVWHKSVGDTVAPGEPLFEIETDKTSMEVPTTIAGVLSEIRVAAGATVPVGSVVAVLSGAKNSERADHVGKAAAAGAVPKPSFDPFHSVRTPERSFGPATLRNGVKVTPLARRLAVQSAVDLDRLAGSGPHGRIVARDVQAVAMNDVTGPDQAAPAVGGTTARQIKAMFDGVPLVEIPLEPMRRSIARRLIEAKQTIPHFYLTVDIEMDRLASMRSELNAQAGDGGKISINDFIIKAMSLALQRVPKANAVWAQDCILRFEHSDVAVAMAVESGLFTPVIRQAEIKSIGAISEEVKALAERARSKALKSVEYRGGSITISNLGMYGVRSFSAIVNPPQSAILAVGATDRRPVEGPDSSVRFASVMTVTLSCDHRVIDGVLGAQLLAAFKLLMEAPRSLLG